MAKDTSEITLKVLVGAAGEGASFLQGLAGQVPGNTAVRIPGGMTPAEAALNAENALISRHKEALKHASSGGRDPGSLKFPTNVSNFILSTSNSKAGYGFQAFTEGEGGKRKKISVLEYIPEDHNVRGTGWKPPTVTDGATSVTSTGVKDKGTAPTVAKKVSAKHNISTSEAESLLNPALRSHIRQSSSNRKSVSKDVSDLLIFDTFKYKGWASQGFYNNHELSTGTYVDGFQIRDAKTKRVVGSYSENDVSRLKNIGGVVPNTPVSIRSSYNVLDTFKRLPQGDARHQYALSQEVNPKSTVRYNNIGGGKLLSLGESQGAGWNLTPRFSGINSVAGYIDTTGKGYSPGDARYGFNQRYLEEQRLSSPYTKSKAHKDVIYESRRDMFEDATGRFDDAKKSKEWRRTIKGEIPTTPTPQSSYLSNLLDLITKKPAEGSTVDILGKASKTRGGSGSGLTSGGSVVQEDHGGHGGPGGPSGNKRGGWLKQGAEQMRHAAWWSLYMAPLSAGIMTGSKFFGGDRYAEQAAHDLIGVGMYSQEDRNRVLEYGRRQSERIPYTRPQDFINAYKETTSGLGVDPTPENIPELMDVSKNIHTYSKYAMQNVSTAARSISRQTTQAKAVAPEFKNMSTTQTADYISNVLAGIYKTSSVKGEEMDTFMRYGGSALMGEKGMGWDYSTTAAFGAQLIQSGLGGSQAGVSSKHIGTGVPFFQQLAKVELIKRKMRENASNPKVGWTRNAIPHEMFKDRYWTKNIKALDFEASKQAKIFKSGPEAALSQLHEYSTAVTKMSGMGLKMRGLTTEQMMPLIQLYAQQSKSDAVGKVSEMDAAGKKAAKEQEIARAQRAEEYDTNISGSWSKIGNWVSNKAAEAGQHFLGGTLNYFGNYLESNEAAINAVKGGNKKEAAARYIKLASASEGAHQPGVTALRRDMVYTEVINQLKLKGASPSNKISSSQLPDQLREYITKEYLVGNKYYPKLNALVSDLPQLSVKEHQQDLQVSGAKFKLPLTGVGGLPGQNDLIKEIQLIPDKIGEKLGGHVPDVTVNVNGVDATVTIDHTNKPVTGVPAAPANITPPGYFKWGLGGREQYGRPLIPKSAQGMAPAGKAPTLMPGSTANGSTKFWGSQTK